MAHSKPPRPKVAQPARPTKRDGTVLFVRVAESDKRRFVAAADHSRIALSAWVRAALVRAVERDVAARA